MYPYPFTYLSPRALTEAVDMLAQHASDDAKVLAGGQSLIPLMRLRFAEPRYLVDLGRIPGLGTITEDTDGLRIGALVRERDLEHSDVIALRYPALLDTASVIADPVVRNLATVGGNLAHGDPANDHPATMIALGASIVAEGPEGVRNLALDDLFEGPYETSLDPTEILREIRVPAPVPGSGAAYEKLERQVGDFAVVGTAVWLQLSGGLLTGVRIALTNVGPTPHRARRAEEMLTGGEVTEDVLHEAARIAACGIEFHEDHRGSAAYKRRVATAVTLKALRRACARARKAAR